MVGEGPATLQGPALRGRWGAGEALGSLVGRWSLGGRPGRCWSRWRGHTGLQVVGIDNGLGDVGGRTGEEHDGSLLLLLGHVDDQGVALLLRICVQHFFTLEATRL